MANDVAPYNQDSFPVASAWGSVQDVIANRNVNNHTIHVAWKCAEYALTQVKPDSGVTLPGGAAPDAAAMTCSDDEARRHIDALAKGTVQAGAVGVLPWASILSLVIQAILAILNKPKG
jgi:hypothetical protein